MGTHPCVVWFSLRVLPRSQAEAISIEPLPLQPQHPHAPPKGSPSIRRPGLSYAGKSQNFQWLWQSSSKRDSNWSLPTHRPSGCNGEMFLHTTHRIPSRMGPRCHSRNPLRKPHPYPRDLSPELTCLLLTVSWHLFLTVLSSGSSWGEQAQAKSYQISFFHSSLR